MVASFARVRVTFIKLVILPKITCSISLYGLPSIIHTYLCTFKHVNYAFRTIYLYQFTDT